MTERDLRSRDRLISKLYNDPSTGFISADKLYIKAKKINPEITLKQIKEWYAKQDIVQQHQTINKSKEYFKIASNNPDSWQMDLMFFGSKTVFIAVNINSRIGFARVLANKRAETIIKALDKFIKENNVQIITSDNGSEFISNAVENFLKKNQIEHYNNEVGDHTVLGKIDRFIRTIKQRLIKINPKTLTQKLVNSVISNYNNTYHSSLGSTPNENKGQIMDSELKHNDTLLKDISKKFEIGDHVRYRLEKGTFEKEKAQWSKAVYEIIGLDGYKFELRSKNKHILYKSPNDLKVVQAKITDAHTENNDIFEAKEILDHRKVKNGFKYLVKWSDSSESWEPQKNLRLINKNKKSTLENIYFSKE